MVSATMIRPAGFSALVILSTLLVLCSPVAVLAAQPSLPTTFYGRVVYSNNTPAEGLIVQASWQDNTGAVRTSLARTLTVQEAAALGQPQFAGYYFFNEGYVQAQESSSIAVAAQSALVNRKLTAKPGGAPLVVEDLLLPDLNDKSPPQVVEVQFRQAESSVSFVTSELATATVRYGTDAPSKSASAGNLSLAHKVFLSELKPFTSYLFEVIATDSAGNTVYDNNGGQYYRFTTGSPLPGSAGSAGSAGGGPPGSAGADGSGGAAGAGDASSSSSSSQAASGSAGETSGGIIPTSSQLPTTIYGQLVNEKGVPVENAEMIATWNDAQGRQHELATTTLSKQEAEKLGDPSLAGYYFFQKNVTLPQGVEVQIASLNETAYHARAVANPGGNSRASVITRNFLPRSFPGSGSSSDSQDSSGSASRELESSAQAASRRQSENAQFFSMESVLRFAFFLLLVMLLGLATVSFRHFLKRPRASNASKRLNQAIQKVLERKARDFLDSKSEMMALEVTDTFQSALSSLLEKRVPVILVQERGVPKGLVSEESVATQMLLERKSPGISLREAALLPLARISPSSTLFEVYTVLSRQKQMAAVVVDHERVIGIITYPAFARVIADFFERNSIDIDETSLPDVQMLAEDVALEIRKSVTLREVKELMVQKKSTYALVSGQDGKLPGIITDYDILAELYTNPERAGKIPASYVAKAPIRSVGPYASVLEANKVMLEGFKRLGVLKQGTVVGMITQESVVGGIITFFDRTSKLVKTDSGGRDVETES